MTWWGTVFGAAEGRLFQGLASTVLSYLTSPFTKHRSEYSPFLENWHSPKIGQRISGASNISVYDSFFSKAEVEHLDSCLPDIPKSKTRRMTLTIVMCDPRLSFGAQRLFEMEGTIESEPNRTAYWRVFERCIVALKELAERRSYLDLDIYIHRTMPGVRRLVIDDCFVVVSDFPLGKANPINQVSVLRRTLRNGAVNKQIQHYLDQGRRLVRKHCELIYSSVRRVDDVSRILSLTTVKSPDINERKKLPSSVNSVEIDKDGILVPCADGYRL